MLGRLVDEATLRRAEGLAGRWRVSIQEVLITLGWIAEEEYVRALARHLQLPVADAEQLERSRSRTPYPPSPKVLGVALEDQEFVVIEARAFSPHVLRSISAGRASSARFCLASRATITRAAERQVAPFLVDKAVNGLWRQAACSSARTRHYLWQAMLAAVFCGLAVGGLVAAPELAAPTLAALLAVPFLCVVALRTSAAIEILRPSRRTALPDAAERQAEAELPLYSVLVPLLREAAVLPRLVYALSSMDYPAAKLQILLALESDDAETRAAAGALDLPGNFEIVLVPRSGPRTKPKALNYALELARGEFVVVYDAEDVPAPDQIRRAVAMFRGAPGSLACIQARLNIYNPDDGWLTRQFALEYSALFDAILPALDSLRLPLPLGGSSNHFRADLLRRVGGWDPYNVTEDADLGFRLARTGLLTVTLDSTTWEEAPARIGNWMRQRTRWIKGWIITYLVHTRAPGQLLRDLGWRRCAALHVLMGAILLSALFHPLCYALLAYGLLENCLFSDPSGSLGSWLWWIALFNLAVGHLSAILVAAVAVLRRGRPRLALHALLMPVYWLLISLAGYRSLVQLVRAPYLWEKTEHGARLGPRRRAGPRHQGSF